MFYNWKCSLSSLVLEYIFQATWKARSGWNMAIVSEFLEKKLHTHTHTQKKNKGSGKVPVFFKGSRVSGEVSEFFKNSKLLEKVLALKTFLNLPSSLKPWSNPCIPQEVCKNGAGSLKMFSAFSPHTWNESVQLIWRGCPHLHYSPFLSVGMLCSLGLDVTVSPVCL